MRTLIDYIREELATPMNTIGMGNPGCDANDNCTEPLVIKKDKKKRSKKTS